MAPKIFLEKDKSLSKANKCSSWLGLYDFWCIFCKYWPEKYRKIGVQVAGASPFMGGIIAYELREGDDPPLVASE